MIECESGMVKSRSSINFAKRSLSLDFVRVDMLKLFSSCDLL